MDSYLLSKERVDDKFQWMCEGPSCTGILAGCDKIHNVVKCPEVLVLHLVRWAEDGSPLQHHVEAEQCIKVLRGGESEAYTLTGVVCRQGEQADVGHYYSFALHNGKWYLYNDALRKEATPSQVRSHGAQWLRGVAYLLFYQKGASAASPQAASQSSASNSSTIGQASATGYLA